MQLGFVAAFFLIACSLHAQRPIVYTLAGSVRGYFGDGGPAILGSIALSDLQNECDPAQYEQTSLLSVDSNGTVYVADSANHRIRTITAGGIIATIAGSGEKPATNARCEGTGTIGDGLSATVSRLFRPSAVAQHPDGSLLIADQQNNRIRQVSTAGIISTIAGSGQHNLYAPGVPATASPMDWPTGLAVDASGAVYFSELHGNRVGRIGNDGRLTTIAGNGFPGFGGDGSPARAAFLRKPAGITVDSAGNLYIADSGSHRIRKVDSSGIIRTIAGTGIAGFAGDDGNGTEAMLNTPLDVKLDSKGNIYIADAGNHRVRRIDSRGIITTVAGTGEAALGEELIAADSSALNFPSAVAVDSKDDVYVADWQNYRIRKLVLGTTPEILPGGVMDASAMIRFPESLQAGAEIVIQGVNFSDAPIVEMNGIQITPISIQPTQIIALLPPDIEGSSVVVAVTTAAGRSNELSVVIAR